MYCFGYLIPRISRHPDIWTPGRLDIWISGYPVTCISGYGYLDVWRCWHLDSGEEPIRTIRTPDICVVHSFSPRTRCAYTCKEFHDCLKSKKFRHQFSANDVRYGPVWWQKGSLYQVPGIRITKSVSEMVCLACHWWWSRCNSDLHGTHCVNMCVSPWTITRFRRSVFPQSAIKSTCIGSCRGIAKWRLHELQTISISFGKATVAFSNCS